MKRGKKNAGALRLLAALAVSLTLLISTAAAQVENSVADQLAKALQNYVTADFDDGITITQPLLKRNDLQNRDSVAIFAVMSMLTYGKGQAYLEKSFEYLKKIAGVGPCVMPLPYEFWPQEIRDHWYKLLHDQNQLVCPEEGDVPIKTIAVMEFDNYSTGKYQEELGFITKGLAEFFEADFSKLSDLQVVERDKIDFLLKEIQLSQAGMVDQSTAVRVGKLLGAQIMVFGSLTQLDGKNAKMLVKAVKVETSEIIASVEREGKPEYFQMEKELVKELAAKLDLTLNKETEQAIDAGGTSSMDAATMYSKGLFYQDKYEYAQAYEFFKKAYEMDNTFAEAKRKMEIYKPLALS